MDRDLFQLIESTATAAAQTNYLTIEIEPIRQALLAAPLCIHQQREPGGDSPLHVAVEYGLEPVVALLLQAGADPNVRNTANWTPLDIACQTHWGPSEQLIRDLLSLGAKAEDGTRSFPQPIDLLFLSHLPHESHDAARLLIQAGAHPSLWAAVCLLAPPLVDSILAHDPATWRGRDITQTQILRVALEALYYANERPNALRVLLALLRAGFDPNERDERGWNLFHYASTGRCSEVVLQQLLPHMRDINSLTTDGKTALELCQAQTNMEQRVLEFLYRHGAR